MNLRARIPSSYRTDAALVAWTLLAKAAVLVLGVAALAWSEGRIPSLLEPWHRWDAPHFTDLAVLGYRAEDPGYLATPGDYAQASPGHLPRFIVFPPLFPSLIAVVNAVIADPVVAAFVVSTVASLFVAPILYRLVAADLDPRVARWSAALLLVFPTAFFLHIGYTESLFLALAFGSLWTARERRWWMAAILACLATLTRLNGLILAPALGVEGWLQWRSDRRVDPAALLAPAGALVGFGVYLALNAAVHGDPLAFTEMQRTYWNKELAPPWEGILGMVEMTRHENPAWAFTLGWMELLFTGIALAATLATIVWLRPTWGVWMGGSWLLVTSTGYVQSVPRYSLALFGVVVWGAIAANRWPRLGWLIGIASAAVMAHFAWRFGSWGIGPH